MVHPATSDTPDLVMLLIVKMQPLPVVVGSVVVEGNVNVATPAVVVVTVCAAVGKPVTPVATDVHLPETAAPPTTTAAFAASTTVKSTVHVICTKASSTTTAVQGDAGLKLELPWCPDCNRLQ